MHNNIITVFLITTLKLAMPPHCARNWVDNWKQTVGYFVTTGSMNPVIMQEALLDCIVLTLYVLLG